MRVLFLPDYTARNPYQSQLANALTDHGVQVRMTNATGRFPLVAAARAREKPDILHLHWTHRLLIGSSRPKNIARSLRTVSEVLAIKRLGVRLVWTVHNLIQHDDPRGPGDPGVELFFQRLLSRLYDRLIVHSRSGRDAVIETYRLNGKLKDKVHIVYHGNYIGAYENSMNRNEARRRLGLEDGRMTYLFFGQVRSYKGVSHLIEQFKQVADSSACLVIAGHPADESRKQRLLEHCSQDERILADLRFIPDDDVQVFMNAADVVVLPYLETLTSAAALLAFSFGKAVIAPRLPYINEVLAGDGGLLYDPEDKDGLLRCMEMASSADLASMGRRNLLRAREFDWYRLAGETHEVYRLARKGAA